MTNKKMNEAELIEKLAEELLMDSLKIYTTSQLNARFVNVENDYQHDLVIRHMGGIFENMAKREPTRTVTSSEIGKIYDHIITLYPKSKFKEAFGDLLVEDVKKQTISDAQKADMIRHDVVSNTRTTEEIQQESSDNKEKAEALEKTPDAFSELSGYFDNDLIGEGMHHSAEIKELGSILVKSEVGSYFTGKVGVDIKVSTPDLLLYLATLETSDGKRYLNVPIEIKQGNLLMPTVVASNNSSIYDLSTEGLNKFFTDERTAEKETLAKKVAIQHERYIYDGVREDLADIEIIEPDPFLEEIKQKECKLNIPELEDMLQSSVLKGESKFGSNLIEEGTRMTRAELQTAGFQNNQIRFLGDNGNEMTYKATINTYAGKVEVTIPVEVVNGLPIVPCRIEAENGDSFELSNAGIEKYIGSNEESVKPAFTVAFIGMNHKELKSTLQKAASNREYDVAAEVVAFIGEKFGEEAQKAAVSDYQVWLEDSSADFSKKEEAYKGMRLGNPVKIDEDE